MFTRKAAFSAHRRAAVIATIAAVAVTAVEPSLALAGPAPSGKGLSAATATSDATDFSACRGGGGAAAAAAFAGIVGTGLAIAAAQSRPAYYGYYGGPAYYGGDPYYYGGGPYYYLLWRWSLLLRRIWLWRRALLSGPSLSQLVTANLCNQLIRRSLWLADFCLLALAR